MSISTRRKSNTFCVILIAVAALGGFLFGYDTAVINGAVAVSKAFNTSSWLTGLAVAAFCGGQLGSLNKIPCGLL